MSKNRVIEQYLMIVKSRMIRIEWEWVCLIPIQCPIVHHNEKVFPFWISVFFGFLLCVSFIFFWALSLQFDNLIGVIIKVCQVSSAWRFITNDEFLLKNQNHDGGVNFIIVAADATFFYRCLSTWKSHFDTRGDNNDDDEATFNEV